MPWIRVSVEESRRRRARYIQDQTRLLILGLFLVPIPFFLLRWVVAESRYLNPSIWPLLFWYAITITYFVSAIILITIWKKHLPPIDAIKLPYRFLILALFGAKQLKPAAYDYIVDEYFKTKRTHCIQCHDIQEKTQFKKCKRCGGKLESSIHWFWDEQETPDNGSSLNNEHE